MRSISAAMALYALCLSALIVPESSAQKIRPEARSRKTESQQNADVKSESTPSVIQSPTSSQIDIVGPTGSGLFGIEVQVLPNGNIVVVDHQYDITSPSLIQDVGAVYLFDGETLEVISKLTGSTAGDQIGGGANVTVLPNGNFVVRSRFWDNGLAVNAGATTFCHQETGCDGPISPANFTCRNLNK